MKKRSRQMPKKVMGFFGTREGAGCTHMALSVANYLHSVEKWEVMYLELGDFSHLYPMFSDRVVEKSGDILYAYQGVFYLICPKEKEALRLLDAFDGMMVIDFGRFAKENPLLESKCQRRVLMGGLQPWEREAYATCIEKNKKKRKIVLFILKIFIIIINTLFLVFLMLQKYCAAIALALYKKDRN